MRLTGLTITRNTNPAGKDLCTQGTVDRWHITRNEILCIRGFNTVQISKLKLRAGKYGVATGKTAEASCTVCDAGKYGNTLGQTSEASCTACGGFRKTQI